MVGARVLGKLAVLSFIAVLCFAAGAQACGSHKPAMVFDLQSCGWPMAIILPCILVGRPRKDLCRRSFAIVGPRSGKSDAVALVYARI